MRLASACTVVLLLTVSVGCDLLSKKDEQPETPLTPTAAPSALPAASVATAPKVEEKAEDGEDDEVDPILKEIPTPEDFEEEAVEDINAANLDQELDKIEKEIEG